MKKRVLSILLCLCMVLALCPVTALAEEGKTVSFTVTADKTEAQPGDTINFTLTMGPVKELGGLFLELRIPEGLTFVEDSGTMAEGLETTMSASGIQIIQNSLFWITECNYTSTADTVLMTFQCTVNADAEPGAKTVGAGLFEDHEGYCFDVDQDRIAATFTPATVTVPEPALAITVGGFYVGNTPADCTVTMESTNLGVTFGEADIFETMWRKVTGDSSHRIANEESFEDGEIYIFQISLKNYTREQAPATTVNGSKASTCRIDPASGHLVITKYLGTPAPAPSITINGPDVICAEENYRFTATASEGVTFDGMWRLRYNIDWYSRFTLNKEDDGTAWGVVQTYYYTADSFELTVSGTTDDGKPVSATKTVQVSQEHIYVDGVCGCGAVKTYTITYDANGGEGSIPAGTKTHDVDFTLSSGTFTRKGCVQTGWVDQNGNEYELGGAYTRNEDMTFYPVWDGIPADGELSLSTPLSKDLSLMCVELKNLGADVDGVKIAVWSTKLGKSTLKEFAAENKDGVWTVNVPLCAFDLCTADVFQVEAYGVTADESEWLIRTKADIVAAPTHVYTDEADNTCNSCGRVRKTDLSGVKTTPMYRLYNPFTGEHFYTGSTEERDNLSAIGWKYEGVAWNSPVSGGTPVHRVCNPNSGDHHYTTDMAEVLMLLNAGWQYENICWNSAFSNAVPQYRMWNKNADLGSHHYTSSTEERKILVDAGWILEGIGWYGMKN